MCFLELKRLLFKIVSVKNNNGPWLLFNQDSFHTTRSNATFNIDVILVKVSRLKLSCVKGPLQTKTPLQELEPTLDMQESGVHCTLDSSSTHHTLVMYHPLTTNRLYTSFYSSDGYFLQILGKASFLKIGSQGYVWLTTLDDSWVVTQNSRGKGETRNLTNNLLLLDMLPQENMHLKCICINGP